MKFSLFIAFALISGSTSVLAASVSASDATEWITRCKNAKDAATSHQECVLNRPQDLRRDAQAGAEIAALVETCKHEADPTVWYQCMDRLRAATAGL